MTLAATPAASGWPVWIGAWIVLASVAGFVMHGLDKRAAIHGRRRVPEARLHLLELVGGWPGALVGMWIFHHKVRKPSYLLVTASIVAAWVAAAIWLILDR
jgi:uncharacterized membrane protein YsdA (DUF1294 family)